MRVRFTTTCAALLVLATSAALGQNVTREEYDKLKAQLEQVQKEMAEMKKQPVVTQAELDQTIDEIMRDAKLNRDNIADLRLGTTKFLITGYAVTGYTDRQRENSTFSAGFNPIFLWQLNDRLFFEGELEFELEDGETSTMLEYADISYVINDYLTVGGGKFLLPFGQFNPRLHPAWINKLPDRPLPYSDEVGIAPESDIGAFARGAASIGKTKINYALYIANGPGLNTDSPDDAGKLNFDNTSDNNDNKAVGGRIGFLPIPELEVGYSFQFAEVQPGGFETTNAFLQAVDAVWRHDFDQIKGTVELRAEWVFSNVDKATYDATGAAGFGPLRFSNDRNGGYVQAAYRPAQLNNRILRNLELIGRYDTLNVPSSAPGSFDETRWTIGLDYWVTPSMVVKTAYQFDDTKGEPDKNALLIQAGLGF